MNADPPDLIESTESTLEQFLSGVVRVRRHLWLVALAAIAGLAITTVSTIQQPQFYRASVTMLVDSRPPRVTGTTEVNPEEQMQDRERFINSQVRILTSQSISEKVEQRLHMLKGSLAGTAMANVDRASFAMAVEVSDPDPDRAILLSKTFADVFMESTVSERTGVATDAARFLHGEANDQRNALEKDEKLLYDFNKTNELPASNFEESHMIASSTLEKLNIEYAQARAAGFRYKAQLEQLTLASTNPELQRSLMLTSPTNAEAHPDTRVKVLSEQLQQLETRYGPQHPKVVETRQALEAVAKMLSEDVSTQLAAVKARARANDSEQAQLHAAIAAETHNAVLLRQKELDYNRIKRHLDEDRDAYSMVAKRQREIELQAGLKQGYVRWLEGPNAAAPVSRNFPRNLVLGLLFGLLIGIGLAYVLDLLDDTLKTPFEAEQELSPALLGIMMSIPVPSQTPAHTVEATRAEHLLRNPRSVVAEQCQSFTTQIYSLFLDAPPRVLMVVSSAVEDGKTLVAANLALTAAARGKRVLLVDADLRRGRLHKLFQLSRKGGLFELVTQKISLSEATRRTFIPNVDVVPTGEVPEKLSPVRVFEHKELAGVFATMREQYDLIVLDTPPVPLVSDAMLLSGLVDGAIGVARAGKTSRKLANRLREQLVLARVNFLGWVLNDVPESELKSKYYYRYGYGRGYAYSQEKRPEEGA